jgi:glycosyltransferase involved in cell wall biosynthesis
MLKAEILHDYFAIKGGGEKLVLSLAEHLNVPVTGGFIKAGMSFDGSNINSLKAFQGFFPLQFLSLVKRWQAYQTVADTVIFSGVYAPLAAKGSAKNILYCHTPPRFIYDKKDYFLARLPAWQRPILQALIHYFKPLYEQAFADMDIIIANSEHVKRRIAKHLNYHDAKVIYPPCDVSGFNWQGQRGYYLSTARLDSLKRVELIVKAFMQMPNKKLIVASGGDEYENMRQLAQSASNIHFTNWIDETRLKELVANCIATIYIPIDEDFGISPVESMAAGKPVIGVAEGGLLETVVNGETGILINDVEVESLIEAVEQMTAQRALDMRFVCEQRAALFNREIFLENFEEIIL